MFDYLRDPAEISRRSFAAIRAETDLSGVPAELRGLALRLVHACAMPDIVPDLAWSAGAGEAGRRALGLGAAVLVDAEMAAQGIIRERLPAENDVVCTLGDPHVAAAARSRGVTRAAAAVDLWRDRLQGAVVAIGTAPTALFRLLELLSEGAPRPALVLGFPVGFVGAAESKEALAANEVGVAYVTLRGRRGGSALAAAAVNALAASAEEELP
ncbi:MAG: precorrin-8X methylmutase [Alphaproteobacteria bacterium]